jgi:ribosomal protein L30E
MLIIIDARLPKEAKTELAKYGEIIAFQTENISYSAISGHPDIFLCQLPKTLICAPNIPKNYRSILEQHNISFKIGKQAVGSKFPETTFYNCLVDESYIFHKKGFSDKQILNEIPKHKFISIPQAYSRCSLIALPGNIYITSDRGIEKALKQSGLSVYYFAAESILLPGMKHGFIGGALAYYSGKVFAIGNPDFHSWGKEFRELIHKQNLQLISLYNGPFFDGGGIFFLEND